jgi:hypothetical protein
LSFELLNDLICIDDASYFFEPAEGIFVIIELLFLVILIMFVRIGEGGCGLGIVEGFLLLFLLIWIGTLELMGDVFIDLLFFVVEVFMSHLLNSDPSLLKSF